MRDSAEMDDYAATRTSLHGIAEGVLAGAQLEQSGTIRLRVLQGGFGTVAEPVLRVAGDSLVRADGARVPLRGTFAQVAQAAGVGFTVPTLYSDHAPVAADDPVRVDAASAARIAVWFERGRQALVAVEPAQQPVLWPEHFDLAVTVDEVNLGVSPGDGFSAEPYAYVGPWGFDDSSEPYAGSPFWNAPFGATLPMPAAPQPAALVRFFSAGLTRVRQARR